MPRQTEAVGVATVGIYWLTNLANSGPLSCARHRHALSLRTACPTCGRQNIDERCEHDESFVADVSVDAVLAPAMDLVREPAPPSPALHHALPAYRYA